MQLDAVVINLRNHHLSIRDVLLYVQSQGEVS